MKQLMHEAIASQTETFCHEIDHYERLRDGHITSREITSMNELPIALIEARIAVRLTQRQLAERVGVAEQQIQRWRPTTTAAWGWTGYRASPTHSAYRSTRRYVQQRRINP